MAPYEGCTWKGLHVSLSKIPAWIPNWRDLSAYTKLHIEYVWPDEQPPGESVSPAEEVIFLPIEEWPWQVWVWEFLRRNAEYRADYERFTALPTFRPGGGKTPKLSGRSPMLTDDMAFRYCDPPALPGETVEQYWARLDGKVVAEMALEEHLMEKWCITTPADPTKDDGYRILVPDIEMPPYHLQIAKLIDDSGYVSPLPPPDEPEHVTLRFDLRYGIDAQLGRAKEILLFWKAHLENGPMPYPLDQKQVKLHIPKFPEYLRAFDAAWTGTNLYEIGETLYPHKELESAKDAAGYAVNAGKDLINGGYKDIIRFKERFDDRKK
jgi:hypothetical protein